MGQGRGAVDNRSLLRCAKCEVKQKKPSPLGKVAERSEVGRGLYRTTLQNHPAGFSVVNSPLDCWLDSIESIMDSTSPTASRSPLPKGEGFSSPTPDLPS